MPGQYCDHERQGSGCDFQGHPVEGRPSVKWFGPERGIVWAQNVLGKAAEIAEHPQKINPVPTGGGDVFHPLIGLECDENSLWEQGKLRGDVNASCLSAVRLPDTARATGYHERCCG